MERKDCIGGILWERQKESDHIEDLDVGGMIMLNWALVLIDGVVWTGFIWHRTGTSARRAVMNPVINLWVP
jgi:hypothetical protein